MYLSMLKRDLKDQKALNAVLFIFMIVAAAAMVTGATLLYSLLAGEKLTYEKCNTSDIVAIIPVDMSDAQSTREDITGTVMSWDITSDISLRQVVELGKRNLIVYDEEGNRMDLPDAVYIVTAMPDEHNIPYTLNGERFEVPNGCVAIPQMTANRMGLSVGDPLRLVTQMGNIYEFTICQIYRDPVEMATKLLILSDRDTEIFYGECPVKSDYYEIYTDTGDEDYINTLSSAANDTILQYEDQGMKMGAARIALMQDEGIMVIIIIVAITIVAFFVMTMIMTTIDFSIKSMVKREARQIGMMKAIGVWSISYKLLYIVKYMAFCIICGIAGLPLGFLLSEKVYDTFVYDVIFPDSSSMIAIGALAMTVNIGCILLFCLLSLRRMNKISVIDAIHGENRGERFARLPGLSFVRTKKMGAAPFLAVSDILRSIKRYVYLIIAYTLGISAVLFMVQLKDSILDIDYIRHYFQRGRIDFNLELDDEYMDRLLQQAGSYNGMYDILNGMLQENDIPARLVLSQQSTADIYFEGTGQIAEMTWQDDDITGLYYLPGGDAPVLYNEVALNWYRADQMGINIGDTVTLEYDRYSEDHTCTNRVSEDFIVTGFVDYHGTDVVKVIMSHEFEGARFTPDYIYSAVIDAPESEHEAIRERMRSVWSEDQVKVLTPDDVVNDFLRGYDLIFNMMIAATAVAAAGVLILLTCLYENIFIEEETADIALLKSMGFRRSLIRGWHMIRLMILGVVSMGLALLFTATAGNELAEFLFVRLLRNCSFALTVDPVHNFVIIPLVVITGLIAAVYLMTGLTDRIQIWKVRSE